MIDGRNGRHSGGRVNWWSRDLSKMQTPHAISRPWPEVLSWLELQLRGGYQMSAWRGTPGELAAMLMSYQNPLREVPCAETAEGEKETHDDTANPYAECAGNG